MSWCLSASFLYQSEHVRHYVVSCLCKTKGYFCLSNSIGLQDLVIKNTGHTVQLEFQINNEQFFQIKRKITKFSDLTGILHFYLPNLATLTRRHVLRLCLVKNWNKTKSWAAGERCVECPASMDSPHQRMRCVHNRLERSKWHCLTQSK